MTDIDNGSNPGLHEHNDALTSKRSHETTESYRNKPEIVLPNNPNETHQPISRPTPERWKLLDQPDHVQSGQEIPDGQPTEVPAQPKEF